MNSTQDRIRRSIAKSHGSVILRKTLGHLGSPSRVDAALRSLVDAGKLQRIGHGVYAKTKQLDDGSVVLKQGFWELATEALEKLEVDYELHPVIRDYQAGRSNQIPLKLTIIPKQRVVRKLSVGAHSLHYVSNSAIATGANREA